MDFTSLDEIMLGAESIKEVRLGTTKVWGVHIPSRSEIVTMLGDNLASFFDLTDASTRFQGTDGIDTANAGDPLGLLRDVGPNANHASQTTVSKRPVLPTAGPLRLMPDFVDDELWWYPDFEGEAWINTPWGCQKTYVIPHEMNVSPEQPYTMPMSGMTHFIARKGSFTETEDKAIRRYFGTTESPLIVVQQQASVNPSSNNVRVGCFGALDGHRIYDVNGTLIAVYQGSVGPNYVYVAGSSTGPFTVVYPKLATSNTLYLNNQIGAAAVSTAALPLSYATNATINTGVWTTGCVPPMPDRRYNTLSLYTSKISGRLPARMASYIDVGERMSGPFPDTYLQPLRFLRVLHGNCYGTLPDISTMFRTFTSASVEVQGCAVSEVPISAVINNSAITGFNVQNSSLTGAHVDAILSAFANATLLAASGTVSLNGASNAAPSAQGLLDKATLESRGWTVNVNS